MKSYISRITTITIAAALVAAALTFAAPAGADNNYTPSLTPEAGPVATVSVASVATFRQGATAKRKTAIAKAKAKKAAAARRSNRAFAAKASSGDQATQAKSILAGLVAKHPILEGTTVEIGDARGYQAIAFYRSGRIVVSKNHTASLSRILSHEVWHVIDYRDNGTIDWGEKVPPRG